MLRRRVYNWFLLSPWQQILIALLMGIPVGLILKPYAIHIKIIGDLFISGIHMVMVPVVFTSIVTAILSLTDFKTMKRVLSRAFLLYAACMSVAAVIGIAVAKLFIAGQTFHLTGEAQVSPVMVHTWLDWIRAVIPSNPIRAVLEENILQIVVLALIFGISIRMAGPAGEGVARFFQSLSAVVFKWVSIIMTFAPYGVFALIAWTFAELGWSALMPLCKFIVAVYLGCVIQLLVYAIGLMCVGNFGPRAFFKGISGAMAFAFSTASSAATLPLSIRCSEEELGIDKSITRFLLPLGASFNLNGLSIYLSVATVFAASWYNVHLDLTHYFLLVTTIVSAAMGAAAIPGSALVVMSAIMSAVGVPLGAVALIAGVDRINDMAQTATNVAGDIFVATIVAKPKPFFSSSKNYSHQQSNL